LRWLLEKMPASSILHGDKGYDSDAIRRQVEAKGAMPNIPPEANRRWKNCFSPFLYKNRNAIERMFCRLKDYRRIATRYDRLATNLRAFVNGFRKECEVAIERAARTESSSESAARSFKVSRRRPTVASSVFIAVMKGGAPVLIDRPIGMTRAVSAGSKRRI
jgi:transposase